MGGLYTSPARSSAPKVGWRHARDEGARTARRWRWARSWLTLRLAVGAVAVQSSAWSRLTSDSRCRHQRPGAQAWRGRADRLRGGLRGLLRRWPCGADAAAVWARGPAIVLELLLFPIGYSMATSGLGRSGSWCMALGLAGAGSLLAPSTRAALGIR